jgi:hypothetical protein
MKTYKNNIQPWIIVKSIGLIFTKTKVLGHSRVQNALTVPLSVVTASTVDVVIACRGRLAAIAMRTAAGTRWPLDQKIKIDNI